MGMKADSAVVKLAKGKILRKGRRGADSAPGHAAGLGIGLGRLVGDGHCLLRAIKHRSQQGTS